MDAESSKGTLPQEVSPLRSPHYLTFDVLSLWMVTLMPLGYILAHLLKTRGNECTLNSATY
jgi:hypothetical protein